MTFGHANALFLTAAIFFGACSFSSAGEVGKTPEDPAITKVIEDYCIAVSDKAGEQRAARQALALEALQKRVEESLNLLEEEKTALEALLKQRDVLRNLAEKEVVDIYAGMDVAAAAAQLEKVDSTLSASVLRQLKPRQASSILNEMKPELAARMVKIIAASAATQGK